MPLHVLLLVAVVAVAITGQGAYYPAVQAIAGFGLVLAVVASKRAAAWSRDDLRLAPTPACAALAAWAVASASLNGDPLGAGGYVALLAAVAGVVTVSRRTTPAQRDSLLDATIALAALTALTGWVGVAWHSSPWALEIDGLWRAATTITYPNAAAGLLVPAALVALARLVPRPSSSILAVALFVLLVGAGATLSRGGAVAFAAGVAVLAGLVGPRRLLRAAGAPLLGAAIALASLIPSMPAASHARPVGAAVGLLLGLGATVLLPRVGARGVAAAAVAALAVGVLPLGAGGIPVGDVEAIGDSRLSLADPVRADAAQAALRLAGDRPLTGTGPGRATLTWEAAGGQTSFSQYAHNEYLQVLAELGAVGLALVIALIGMVALAVGRGRSRAPSREVWAGIVAALVAVGVHSAFDFLWHVPVGVVVCAVLIGITSRGTETAFAPALARSGWVDGRREKGVLR